MALHRRSFSILIFLVKYIVLLMDGAEWEIYTSEKFTFLRYEDSQLTWYNSWPQFTDCFQNTVLVWVPCGWLWMTAPFYVYHLRTLHDDWIPLGCLTITKLFASGLLMCTTLVKALHVAVISHHGNEQKLSTFTAASTAPLILFTSLVLSYAVCSLERRKGVITSGVQYVFWLLLTLCGVIPLYHNIIQKTWLTGTGRCVLFFLYYFLVVLQLFLHSFAEKKHGKVGNQCPEVHASFLSRVVYQWTSRLVFSGHRKPLTETDVYDVPPSVSSSTLMKSFLKHWKNVYKEFQKAKEQEDKWKRVTLNNGNRIHFSTDLGEMEHMETAPFLPGGSTPSENYHENRASPKPCPSLLWALTKTFGVQILASHIPKLISDLLLICTPQILGELVTFTENTSVETWKGYVLAVAMFLSSELQSLFLQRVTFNAFAYGMKIRSVLISIIFRKSLTLSGQAKKELTVGEIVNLMSVDTNNINNLVTYLTSVWSSPLQIILALYFLYGTVGNAMFAGLGFLLLMMPFNAFILSRVSSFQEEMMKSKDRRLKVITEVLNGIKVLKLYAWEDSFQRKIEEIRNSELHFLWKIGLFFSAVTFSWTAAPYFVALTTLVTYVLVSPSHHLDAKTAFVAITYFNVIRVAINYLPMVTTNIIRARVSLRRISSFLGHDDLDNASVEHNLTHNSGITIEDASFTQVHDQTPWLQSINLDIPEGSLVAVVGHVGCGKSSLISAILGEMERVQGSVNVKGSVAYVPQQAWIQNITLQENILFGSPMDREWYNQVITACALTPDLEMLPAGDQTEIGEKGINLSGGQKQRVSLARAVYSDADIYLLDDPLSAVDSHVGKHIFRHVIGPEGLLNYKTRLLVTHDVHWLPEVDMIVVLSEGQISEIGNYRQLMSHHGEFAHFLTQHMAQQSEEEHVDQEDMEQHVHAARHEMIKQLISVHSQTELSGDELIMGHVMTRMKRESSRPNLQGSQSVPDLMQLESHMRQRPEKRGKSNHKWIVEKKMKKKTKLTDHLIAEEKVKVGKVSLSVYLMYMRSLGLGSFAIALVMYALYQACQTGGSVWLSRWTDDIKLANTSYLPDSTERKEYNHYYMGVYGLLGGLQALCVLSFAFTIHLRAVGASRLLHHTMLTNIIRSPMSFFDTTPIGRIVNRFSQDCDTMDNHLPVSMEVWLDTASRVLCTVLIITYTTPIFILPLTPLLMMYVFLQRFYVATSRQLKRLESKTRSPIYSHFSESLSGASVIRAYGAEDRFIKESEARVDMHLKYLYCSVAVNRWVGVRLEALGSVIILLASLLSVATRDTVTGGIVGLSLSYATEICNAMTFLTRLTSEVETQVVSVERIKEYTQLKEEAPAHIKGSKLPDNWPQSGRVTFKNYCTRYRPGLDLVLKDVSFSIKPGEKVGIVGRTGAGKSSLVLCLFRLIEAAGGGITIDGLDISSLGLHDLRSKLTVLPQDPVIFTGSLRFNLDPFDEHSDSQIWTALDQAHLKSFIQSLPNLLYEECGEGGENFSVGQRQLLCLARTLLRNSKILILDEATAAVDMETDDLIQKTIRSEFKDCTVLTIAHRLNTVMDYDRILVLDRGHIAEYDRPDRLLLLPNSIFSELARDAGFTQ